MRSSHVVGFAVLTTAASSIALVPAHADNTTAPEAAVVGSSGGRMAGIDLTFAPIGQFAVHADGQSNSTDLETSMGIRPSLDFAVSPSLSIGFAPQVIFGVKTQYDDTSAKQFDLMARATVRLAKSGKLTPIAYGSGGWSTLRLPESRVGHPSGFTFDVGGGLTYDVSPRAFVSAALGYQSSAMGLTVQGNTAGVRTSFLHLGIGVGTVL